MCTCQSAGAPRERAPNLEDLLGMVLQHMQPLCQVPQIVQRHLCQGVDTEPSLQGFASTVLIRS